MSAEDTKAEAGASCGRGRRWKFGSILISCLISAPSVCTCVAPDSCDLSFDRIMNYEANVKGKAANTTLTDQDQESVGYCRLSMVSMFEKWCDVADDDGKPPSDAITPKHDNRASLSVGKDTISDEQHYRMFTLLLQWSIVQDALVAKVDYDAHDQNGTLEGVACHTEPISLPHLADKSPPRQWGKIFLVVTGLLLAELVYKLWEKNQILDKRCRRMDTNLDQLVQTLDDNFRRIDQNVGRLAQQINNQVDQLGRRMDQNANQLGRRMDQNANQMGRRMDQNANQTADSLRHLTTESQRQAQDHRLRQQINNKIADARQVNMENYSFNMLKRVVKIEKNVRQLPQNIGQLQAASQGDYNLENSLIAVVDQDLEDRMDFDF